MHFLRGIVHLSYIFDNLRTGTHVSKTVTYQTDALKKHILFWISDIKSSFLVSYGEVLDSEIQSADIQ
jgi:hypothetical protein